MASASARTRRPRRSARSRSVWRWIALAALGFLGFLYYRPLTTYVETRRALAQRQAEVETLRATRQRLERRLEAARSERQVAAEARKLGYVRPGERLFIVKGLEKWRARARR